MYAGGLRLLGLGSQSAAQSALTPASSARKGELTKMYSGSDTQQEPSALPSPQAARLPTHPV